MPPRIIPQLTALLIAPLAELGALDSPHITAEPQKTGWPLTAAERGYVFEKPEHDRRPGRESNKQYIGYNAAKTVGIQTSGVLDYEHSYDVFMKSIGKHLAFLASTARVLGLPREKHFAHTIVQGVDSYNMDSQFNADRNPSPTR